MINHRYAVFAVAGVLLLACSLIAGQAQKARTAAPSPAFPWPEGKRMALSMSFDDGRPSQIDNGLPLFERYGVKVTFYVNPPAVKDRLDGWKQAVAKGHEIGNHTMTHPCTGNKSFTRQNALENLTLEQIHGEMVDANKVLKDLLGVTVTTFAYPCGNKFVGRGRDVRSYVPLVADLFTVGRNWLSEDANDPFFTDMVQLQAIPSDRQDFERMKALITQAQRRSGWLVFGGHDISNQGSQFTTRISMLEELLPYVKDPANGVWMDTIQNVASYILQKRGDAPIK